MERIPQYHPSPSMSAPADLVAHLVRTTRLSEAEAQRVVLEVLAYFDEPVERFVRRRHAALRADGLQNAQIFARLIDEVAAGRFAASPPTERQIRRMIYG